MLYVPSLTNDSTPEIGGTAEAGSKVEVKIGSIELDPVVVSPDGGYSITPSTALADGTYLISAVATDEAGNTSVASSALSMVIDTVAPVAPTLEGSKLGKESKPTLRGTAEAGSRVTIYKGEPVKDNILGQVPANKEGRYVFVPGVGFADGAHLIRVTATDAAGNVSEASGLFSMRVDTAPPAVPVLTVESPTNESRPEIKVVAEAGSVVTVFSGGSPLSGEATEEKEGVFSFVPETAFADGFYVLKAVATDEAGKEGGCRV